MVQAKSTLFPRESQALANIFKALSHPARIDIIRFLAEQKTCYTGNITDEIPLGRTTINQHLAELKKVGLIKGNIEGTRVHYLLNYTIFNVLKNYMTKFIEDVEDTDIEENENE